MESTRTTPHDTESRDTRRGETRNEKSNRKLVDLESLRADPFTLSVLRRLGPEFVTKLDDRDRYHLIKSVTSCRPLQRHPVDIRGTIPLFFRSYYFVFLMGRDRRRNRKKLEKDRRGATSAFSSLAVMSYFILSFGILLLSVMAVVFYIVKALLDIDLFPDRHAADIIDEL